MAARKRNSSPGVVENMRWYHDRLVEPDEKTIIKLKCCFTYDEEAGALRWGPFATGARTKPGERAGTLTKSGYRVVQFEGAKYPVGRIAWLLKTGRWPKGVIRYADRNPDNHAPDNFYDSGSEIPPAVLKRIDAISDGHMDETMEVFALIADGKREAKNLIDGASCAHHLVRQYLRHMGVEPEGSAEIWGEPQDEDYRDARTALALS